MRRLMGSGLFAYGLATLALCSALALVGSTHFCRMQYATLQRLEVRKWALQEDYSRLLLEHSTWAAPRRVDRLARERLGMRPPSLGQRAMVHP